MGEGEGGKAPSATLVPSACGCCSRTECPPSLQAAHHTAIPLRDQFRLKRFLFSYHDLRALTTSVSSPTCITSTRS